MSAPETGSLYRRQLMKQPWWSEFEDQVEAQLDADMTDEERRITRHYVEKQRAKLAGHGHRPNLEPDGGHDGRLH